MVPVRKSDATALDAFLKQISQIGVSHSFLEGAAIAAKRVFDEVPEERRLDCLETIRETVVRQCETERSCERSLVLSKQLEEKQIAFFQKLQKLRTDVLEVKKQVAVAAWQLYGMGLHSRSEDN